MKLSYIKAYQETLYIKFDPDTQKWDVYEDKAGEILSLHGARIESWVADPGAKLHPVTEQEQEAMISGLQNGIAFWENKLSKYTWDESRKRYGTSEADKTRADALTAEKKTWRKNREKGIARMKAEVKRLQEGGTTQNPRR